MKDSELSQDGYPTVSRQLFAQKRALFRPCALSRTLPHWKANRHDEARGEHKAQQIRSHGC